MIGEERSGVVRVEIPDSVRHSLDVLHRGVVKHIVAGSQDVLASHFFRHFQDVHALLPDLLRRALQQPVQTDVPSGTNGRVQLGESVLNTLYIAHRRFGQGLKQVDPHLVVVAFGQHRLNGGADVRVDQQAVLVRHLGDDLGIGDQEIPLSH